jgi:hypothetical protein
MENREQLRIKLKATLEAKKIARLSEDVAYECLDELKRKGKKMSGTAKESNDIMVSVLKEELDKKLEAYNNMSYGGNIEGGIGYGSGGGSGTEAG